MKPNKKSFNGMMVAKDTVVTMYYMLKNSRGMIIGGTEEQKPAEFVCGGGTFLPSLERSLVGLQVGDEKTIVIPPSEGYGKRDRSLVLRVRRSDLPEGDIKIEQKFRQLFEDGESNVFRVTGFLDDWVFLDGNHPLAGMELHYEVGILDVRPLTCGRVL